MKATVIKATVYTNGELRNIFIPRKVTRYELSKVIKNDNINFSEKAKLVEYEICNVNVELTEKNLSMPVADILKGCFDNNMMVYIM